MMYGFLVVVHVLVALFLVVVILLQGGRGGMSEAMSGQTTQSLFGGAANTVMTRLTAVVASLFMVTSLALAVMSSRHGQSVMDRLPMNPENLPLPAALPSAPSESAAPKPAPSEPAQPVAPTPSTSK